MRTDSPALTCSHQVSNRDSRIRRSRPSPASIPPGAATPGVAGTSVELGRSGAIPWPWPRDVKVGDRRSPKGEG